MQKSNEIELSIVMPCLNEAETLATCIQWATEFLERRGIQGEIVIGDNGSSDGSLEIAEKSPRTRVVNVSQPGYGSAIYHATLTARGRYVIVGDADASYDFRQLDDFVDKLRGGYELVMGNRFQGGIEPGAMPWKNRWIGNPALTGLGKLLFGSSLSDFHCGLRGFTKEAFLALDLRTTGMEFATEMVIKATNKGMSIAEVPTKLLPDGRSRMPHLRPWSDGWRHLVLMLLYSPNWLFLGSGSLLILVASVLCARLWSGPLVIGEVTLGIHTMLYLALLIMVGVQSVSFSLLAKVFAFGEGLLPPTKYLLLFLNRFRIAYGLLLGAGVIALGGALAVYTILAWGEVSFGNLDPVVVVRQIVPSMLLIFLGFQIIFCSFFVALLQLRNFSGRNVGYRMI